MPKTPERILVIKLSALGDFVLALAPLAAIRKHHPDAHITMLTTGPFTGLAARSGYVDEIWEDTRPKWHNLPGWLGLRRKLNAGRFDRVYDLQFNDRTKLYYRLFSPKPEWNGVIKGATHFYPNPDWRDMHAFDRHREVLKVAGIEDMKLPDMDWMDADIDYFDVPEPFVLLVPGSAPSRPDKRWPAIRYAALAQKMIRQGYAVAALGTAAESDAIERLLKACPEVIDLSGRTNLFEIAALARRASGVVGNDTGPMHIIALAGCPSVVLFSANSSPEQSAPRGHSVVAIQCDDLHDLSVKEVEEVFRPRKKETASTRAG